MRGLFEGGRGCEEFSAGYYGVCAVGGWISAGTTHLAITPFDVLKFHMQLLPALFHFGLVTFQLIARLPTSMIMFSTFEHSVNFLYHNVIQRRKEDCSKAQQLGVTCLAGYAARSVGSIISNPADNIVASLYTRKASGLKLAVKKIGLMNLFTRSLPIRIMLVGPVVTLQWLFYDTVKVSSGLPTSGDDRTDVEEIRTT